MSAPRLLAFPGMEPLCARLAAGLGAECGTLRWRHFPDGESLVGVGGDCRERELALVCTLRDPDRLALPLLFAARTARELGARRVGLVAPYLAYMRQDARFHPGEAVSAPLFAGFLASVFDWLVTVDPHLHRNASLEAIFTIPVRSVSAMPLAADWIGANVSDPVLIGPDSESAQWVHAAAARIGAPVLVLDKRRLGDREVEVSLPDRDAVHGHTPVLVDDIIASGHTLIETLAQLHRLGLPPAACVAVHGVFAGDAYRELLAAGAARVATSNTVPHPSNAFEVAAVLLPAVEAMLRGA